MVRRATTVLTLLSVVLSLLTVALWVRSYWRGDKVVYRSTGSGTRWHRETAFASYSGRLSYTRSAFHAPWAPIEAGWSLEGRYPRPGYDMDAEALGFARRRVTAPGRWLWEVRFPTWTLAAAFALPPAAALLRRRWARRATPRGRCRQCGYDLRASPDRCPECGAAAIH